MDQVRFESDYAPGTSLTITRTDDGDIILHIRGEGEMRIATNGGKLHGAPLVLCCNGFDAVMRAIRTSEEQNYV